MSCNQFWPVSISAAVTVKVGATGVWSAPWMHQHGWPSPLEAWSQSTDMISMAKPGCSGEDRIWRWRCVHHVKKSSRKLGLLMCIHIAHSELVPVCPECIWSEINKGIINYGCGTWKEKTPHVQENHPAEAWGAHVQLAPHLPAVLTYSTSCKSIWL